MPDAVIPAVCKESGFPNLGFEPFVAKACGEKNSKLHNSYKSLFGGSSIWFIREIDREPVYQHVDREN